MYIQSKFEIVSHIFLKKSFFSNRQTNQLTLDIIPPSVFMIIYTIFTMMRSGLLQWRASVQPTEFLQTNLLYNLLLHMRRKKNHKNPNYPLKFTISLAGKVTCVKATGWILMCIFCTEWVRWISALILLILLILELYLQITGLANLHFYSISKKTWLPSSLSQFWHSKKLMI